MESLFGAAALVVFIWLASRFIQKRKSSATQPSTPENPSQPVSSQKDSLLEVLESLLSLNLMIRSDHDLEQEILLSIEQIIDDIRLTLPAMMERYPSEVLTYELEKIGKNHLKKIVKEYLDLSPSSRQAQYSIFTGTIENLAQVTKRSREIIEKNETAEFNTMAHFLAGKFS